MAWRRVIWSPVETEYLKKNKDSKPISQLTIALAKSTNAVKKKIAELEGRVPKNSAKKNKISYIGKREDLGNTFMRSRWEANVARWIKHIKKKLFEYEPKNFPFFGVPGLKDITRGTINYMPDFKVPYRNSYIWIEVKGMLRASDKTRIRRFKKYYPQEFKKLKAIVGSPNTQAAKFFKEMGVPIWAYYNDLNKKYKDRIPNWE